MGFFDFFNKKSTSTSVVWRDEKGVIRCLGDSCAQKKCDDTCPIWLKTLAQQMFQMQEYDKSIENFRQALLIAPDFGECWNNLAAVYGTVNNHIEANKAYMTAYSLNNNHKNAIYGLIISYKNLGQFDKAYSFCDEYEKKFGKNEADELRGFVKEAQKEGVAMQLSASDITNKLLAMAREKGVLGPNDHMPYIPEVMCQAASVCEGIVSALMKEKNPNSRNPSVWMMWSLYAGIGSVLLWHHKWEQIKDTGLVSALLAPKGVFAMDEYVTELTGCSFESEQGKELGGFIAYHARLVLNEYVCFDESRSARENMQSLLEAMKALFNFGMVYQMEQLGMK